MKIRNKILIYFSSTVIILSAVSLTIIYVLSSAYREEEFQQRQKVKIKHTVSLLNEYREMSENLAEMMDEQSINDFFDEKLLVFDKDKDLVYSSLDDLGIAGYKSILNNLSPSARWIETKEGDYDVIGVYTEYAGKEYYAISKAYDDFGYSKMYFLRNVLIGMFIAIVLIVIIISFYLSNKISRPITKLAGNLNLYEPGSASDDVLPIDTSSYELQYLTSRFNELLKRTDKAFNFQKNAIHHISHELKTPVAVLVSELEKARNYENIEAVKAAIDEQIRKAKSLGTIINVLLEISKFESGQEIKKSAIRVDEVIFDLISELNSLYPEFDFEVNFVPEEFDERRLILYANKMLIKQALNNLLVNCIQYSDGRKGNIRFDCSSDASLNIFIINRGKNIQPDEEKFIFDHYFRGSNTNEKTGFGLGLVLAKKIMILHGGAISYSSPSDGLNIFQASFPLR